jgi:hypothetical protein
LLSPFTTYFIPPTCSAKARHDGSNQAQRTQLRVKVRAARAARHAAKEREKGAAEQLMMARFTSAKSQQRYAVGSLR